MSYDLNFWKYKKGASRDHAAVYEAACDGETVEELESLPIRDIREKIAVTFSGWEMIDANHFDGDERGAFEIFTTPQFVRFTCYGMREADMNLLMDVLLGFGCPLYDPQISERFDAWTDC